MANKFMQDIKQNRKIGVIALVLGTVSFAGVIVLAFLVL